MAVAVAVGGCRSRYHLTDIVTGRVNFLLVRIRIKYMEVAVIRRESAGPGERAVKQTQQQLPVWGAWPLSCPRLLLLRCITA